MYGPGGQLAQTNPVLLLNEHKISALRVIWVATKKLGRKSQGKHPRQTEAKKTAQPPEKQ